MKVAFNQSKAISTTTQGVGAVGGMLLSKAGMGAAPKSFNMPITKLVVGTMLLVGASTITGKGAGFDLAKGVSFGAGAMQVAEGVAGLLKSSVENLEDGKTKEYAVNAIQGLAGADEMEFNQFQRLPNANEWGAQYDDPGAEIKLAAI